MEDINCSKCQKPIDGDLQAGTARWCLKCRAKYQQEYRELKGVMTERKGFSAGVAAMRDYLATQYDKYGPIQAFTGPSIAKTIRTVPGPALED